MLADFQSTFEEFYDPDDHDTPEEVMNYGFYYMGCIICTGGSVKKIIDGQQRLTSLTLLIYDPDDHDTPEEVMNYGFYYMGCIICTGGSVKKIIDGQQRLTSLTLLIIYLNNLQKETVKDEDLLVPLDDMIYSKAFSKKSFNIDVADRGTCMQALLQKDETYVPVNESSQNMLDRYQDIEDIFPDELKGEALPYFITLLTG